MRLRHGLHRQGAHDVERNQQTGHHSLQLTGQTTEVKHRGRQNTQISLDLVSVDSWAEKGSLGSALRGRGNQKPKVETSQQNGILAGRTACARVLWQGRPSTAGEGVHMAVWSRDRRCGRRPGAGGSLPGGPYLHPEDHGNHLSWECRG